MPRSPFFSVIIPTYNRAALISQAVHSAMRQTFENFEVIIVDDGSTDNTRDVVAAIKDPRVTYHKIANQERAAARNYGVRQAQGLFVTFLDSDDWLRTNHLQVAYDFLSKNQSDVIFSVGYDVVRPDGKSIVKWKVLPDPVNDKLIEGNFLSCLGVFIERKTFLENQFNDDRALSGSEDYELWLRMAARYSIRTVPVSTACLVDHTERSVVNFNTTALVIRMNRLKHYLALDEKIQLRFASRLLELNAYIDLYTALHLAMASDRNGAMQMLLGVVKQHPVTIFSYRLWVVVKKILLG